jgi:hypothetical protein
MHTSHPCEQFHTRAVEEFAAPEQRHSYTDLTDEASGVERFRREPQADQDEIARKETMMLKLTVRYARYILSSFVTVGFLAGN